MPNRFIQKVKTNRKKEMEILHFLTKMKYSTVTWLKYNLVTAKKNPLEEGCSLMCVRTTVLHFSSTYFLWWLTYLAVISPTCHWQFKFTYKCHSFLWFTWLRELQTDRIYLFIYFFSLLLRTSIRVFDIGTPLFIALKKQREWGLDQLTVQYVKSLGLLSPYSCGLTYKCRY